MTPEQIEELLEEDKPATTDVAAENATIMGDNDEIAFPSWWTSAIGAPATAEEETVAVTFNIPNQTSQPGATFGRYVDDALEAEMSDDAFSTESFMQLAAGAVEAVNNSEAGVPQNTPIMAEMPVPEDILKTTLNNIDEDDDEPWTPRPVRQIRL